MNDHVRERQRSLWMLVASPSIWAAHFLLAYVTAAVWCAKVAPPGGSLAPVRAAIAVYTALALAGIAFFGWRGRVRHRLRSSRAHRAGDSPADRERFLGFAIVVLSGLSAIAVVYAALVVVVVRSCR